MSTPQSRKAGRRLGRFAKAARLNNTTIGIALAGGDEKLAFSHPAVGNWIEGSVPSPEIRDAIERLTAEWPEGPILASEWGESKREQADAKRVENVRPHPFASASSAA